METAVALTTAFLPVIVSSEEKDDDSLAFEVEEGFKSESKKS